MAETAGLEINGKTYALDPEDLELGEVELLEDEFDCPLQDIDFNRAAAIRVLVYIFMHRENPAFTMDDAKQIKVAAIAEPPAEKPPARPGAKRPTKAAVG